VILVKHRDRFTFTLRNLSASTVFD